MAFKVGFVLLDTNTNEFTKFPLDMFDITLNVGARDSQTTHLEEHIVHDCTLADFPNIELESASEAALIDELVTLGECFDFSQANVASDFKLTGEAVGVELRVSDHVCDFYSEAGVDACEELMEEWTDKKLMFFYEEMYVKLDDYTRPLRGQIHIAETFKLSLLFAYQIEAFHYLTYNDVTLVDQPF